MWSEFQIYPTWIKSAAVELHKMLRDLWLDDNRSNPFVCSSPCRVCEVVDARSEELVGHETALAGDGTFKAEFSG